MRTIMALADKANEYVDRMEPWKLKKDASKAGELLEVCSVTLNLYRQLVVYLAPVLPDLATKTSMLLGAPIEHWDDAKTPLEGNIVAKFEHLMQRVDPKRIEAMVEASREADAEAGRVAVGAGAADDDGAALEAEPLAEQCKIEDFAKVDLRVARVVSAEAVPEARKLLKLVVSLGGGTTRTVFAGIKAAYEPEALVGRLVIVVANLAPRKMKFGVSEGMVVAAGGGGKEVFLLAPDSGAKPGQRVH